MEANAHTRAAARTAARDPTNWGVSAEILLLPTANDVELRHGSRAQVIAARRQSDPFDLLHSAGSLTDDQHRAARRLFRDWALRAGVRDGQRGETPPVVDGGRHDPARLFTDAVVDAGRRIANVLQGDHHLRIQGVGPVNAKLLTELISPMVDEGRIIAWRGVVERTTGVTDRTSQGVLVKQACEALRLVYEETDEKRRPAAAHAA